MLQQHLWQGNRIRCGKVLSYGLEFVQLLRPILIEVRCDSEIILYQLPVNKFVAITMYDVQTKRACTYEQNNLIPKQRIILNTLRLDDNILICKADKGRSLVIDNRNDYIKAGEDILSSKENFKKL
ncbi:hypothetical protein GJ496_007013 [Pomphorhynchus laevis]|nr:hypothetical protein GJ496_004502 [Pomphorhynchus laevis]KAI0989604.1 hypothetical protein GJ496_007013 [Pomphorhynchus laevis]